MIIRPRGYEGNPVAGSSGEPPIRSRAWREPMARLLTRVSPQDSDDWDPESPVLEGGFPGVTPEFLGLR